MQLPPVMVENGPNMDQVSTLSVVRLPSWMSLRFLAIACLVPYALLMALIVFQNRTIHIQRALIHMLFNDRQHFSRLSPSVSQPGRLAAQNGAQAAGQSSSPSSQGKSEQNSKIGRNSKKARNHAPTAPPAQGSDPTDLRRVSVSI